MNIFATLKQTPLYPHWLEFKNRKKADNDSLKFFRGKVLETGAGNSVMKDWALSNKRVTKYIATDYSSWDEQFTKQNNLITRFGSLSLALFGKPKDPKDLDKVCDALNLPFKQASFDTYCSFEVLEHINDPELFFKEAHRVLKKGGACIISMPYMFREHAEPEDFQRISRGGFHYLAEKTGFKVAKIYTYSFIGTTCAALINQFIIRKIIEGRIATRILLLPLSPFIFLTTNLLGFVIDSINDDLRLATRLHVVLLKK